VVNHKGPIVRGNYFIPTFKDMCNKVLHPRLSEASFHHRIEEFVYMIDEDISSHFENFSLVSFNITSFPLSEFLNPKLNIFQREDILLCESVQDGAYGIRE